MTPAIDEQVRKAAAALRDEGATVVYIFGSVSENRDGPGSDLDLAVEGLPPRVFFRALARASAAAGRPLDLVDMDEDNALTRYLRSSGALRRVG
jgi:predicted nucleotidyltransferase